MEISWMQTLVVALVQGLTEFLPVSSSAHLIIVPALFDWPEQGLAFDIVVHLATLLAVLWVLRKQCWQMFSAVCRGRRDTHARQGWWLIFSPLPLILATLVLGSDRVHELRQPVVIAIATIVFALPLLFAQWRASENDLTPSWKILLFMACAQACAVIPGASRSGVTLAAGALAGLSLPQAARLSFLMAIPTIVLAFVYELAQSSAFAGVNFFQLGVAFVTAFMTATLSIVFFLKLVQTLGLIPFVVYRFMLGVFLLAWLL